LANLAFPVKTPDALIRQMVLSLARRSCRRPAMP
jgi:hypothetical protein